jgi:rod shape determining protein RodA
VIPSWPDSHFGFPGMFQHVSVYTLRYTEYRVARYRSLRGFDWPLLVITLIVCALGVLQIYSATLDTRLHDSWWKQILYILAGLGLMWVVASVDYHTLIGQVPLLYGLSVVALTATIALGHRAGGAKRWLFHFQISELVKIVIILLVARCLSELKKDQIGGRDLWKLGGLVGIPTALVMAQPDLSTAATYIPVLVVGVLLAGLQWRYLAPIALAVALAVPAGWFVLTEMGRDVQYQKSRLTTFLDPSRDPHGHGYQVIQSRIAVGDGGMWGRGVTHGTQTQLRFLPAAATDFVFAAFAEEHGFVVVVVVLGLYFLLLMQIVQNGQAAPDRAGMYICMGVATLLLVHVLVNVGMVVGNVPVSGIPLPLMSAGGSNMISIFMLLGLVNNVRLRRFMD